MAARFLVSRPCEDACCEIMTDQVVEGAPVYRCPGCDSEWIELRERWSVESASVGADVVDEAVPPGLPGSE